MPSGSQRPLSRRTLMAATLAGTVAVVATPAQATAATTRFHMVGRTAPGADGFVQFAWPGVYFEARFKGTGVGVVLDDSVNDYDVQIDGVTVATLVTPGRTSARIGGLADAVHRVRLVKRTERPWSIGKFGGLVAARGGASLPAPSVWRRQM